MEYYIKDNKDLFIETLKKNTLEEEDFDLLRKVHEIYNTYTFYPERYVPIYQTKLDFFEPLLKGKSTLEIDLTTVDSEAYSMFMFESIINRLKISNNRIIDWHNDQEEFFNEVKDETERRKKMLNEKYFFRSGELANYLEQVVSAAEITQNKTSQTFRVGLKRYGEGAKLTRVLSAIMDMYDLWNVKNRLVGNLLPNGGPMKLQLSIHPLSGYLGGMISNSCLSPESSNSFASIIYNGYKNTALIHDKDLTWRAFVSFDFEKKIFQLYGGFPSEKFFTQYLLKEYFKKMGFKFMRNYFIFPAYWDNSTVLGREHNAFSEKHKNYDSYYETTDETSITGNGDSQMIAELFYSDYYDQYYFDEYMAHDSRIYCDYEEEYYYDNEVYWSDLLDSYVSEWGERQFIRSNKEMLVELFEQVVADNTSKVFAAQIPTTIYTRQFLVSLLRDWDDEVHNTVHNLLHDTEYEENDNLFQEIADEYIDLVYSSAIS